MGKHTLGYKITCKMQYCMIQQKQGLTELEPWPGVGGVAHLLGALRGYAEAASRRVEDGGNLGLTAAVR